MSMNALPKRKFDVFFHHIQPKLRVANDVIGYIYKLNDCYELMMFGRRSMSDGTHQRRDTPQGWSLKCVVLNCLEETTYESSSNVPDFGRKMRTSLEEIKSRTLIYPALTVPITPIALTAIEVAAGSKIDRSSGKITLSTQQTFLLAFLREQDESSSFLNFPLNLLTLKDQQIVERSSMTGSFRHDYIHISLLQNARLRLLVNTDRSKRLGCR
jgi:hypothetical protein